MSEPTAEFINKSLFLVDASGYLFRAYYAIQRPLQAPDGTPTQATFGFLQMVQALVDMHGLSHCVLVWDKPGKGFRHELYKEYKANRSAAPEDLHIQIKNTREGIDCLGLPQLDASGFEADDILATLVHKHPDTNFVIVTADKDLLQLVGPRVWCLDTMKKKWSNVDEAKEKFGVSPERIPEIQALCGDSVDNVPGVPGVGPKTAAELIQHFGTLEEVLKTAQARAQEGDGKWTDKLKGKCLESVATHIEDARVSLELVKLRSDAPVPDSLTALARQNPRVQDFRDWATRLGFGKVAPRLLEAVVSPEASASIESSEIEVVAPASAPTAAFEVEGLQDLASFDRLLKAQSQAKLLAVDTETFSLDHIKAGNLVGLSLSFDDDRGYYLPLRHLEGPNLDPAAALKLFSSYLAERATDPGFELVFQNAKFDLHALANDGFAPPPSVRIHDTMVASFILEPAGQHGLDALSVKHLGGYRPLSFDEVTEGLDNFSQVPLEKAVFYAAEDAVVCRRLWRILSERMRSENLWDVYDQLDRPLVPLLLAMERRGILLNPDILKMLSVSFHKELAALQAKAVEVLRESGLDVAPDLNLNSPKQMGVILFEKLGLPVIKKTKTGPSTDVSVLEVLADSHAFPEILLEVREVTKLLSTYIDSLPQLVNPTTGRIHTDFSQTVAATGRLASSNPNLQNIPIKTRKGREIRKAFQAPPGYLFVGVDYSQIELRLLAHLSKDPELLRAFREDADIHRRTAALILGKPEDKVTEDDRRIAKTTNYGIVYGQTAFGLARSLKIPRAVAQTFIDGYFTTYTGIRKYMDAAVAEARATGAVRTLSGRRRPLPEILSKNVPVRQFGERMAINSPLQGLAADLMKAAMLAVETRIQRDLPEARLLLQVHDELVLEVPEAKAETLKKIVVSTMEDPALLKNLGVPGFDVVMKAESSIGSDWGEI